MLIVLGRLQRHAIHGFVMDVRLLKYLIRFYEILWYGANRAAGQLLLIILAVCL